MLSYDNSFDLLFQSTNSQALSSAFGGDYAFKQAFNRNWRFLITRRCCHWWRLSTQLSTGLTVVEGRLDQHVWWNRRGVRNIRLLHATLPTPLARNESMSNWFPYLFLLHSETNTQGSGSPSKRGSKRVSFLDEEASQPLVQHESSPPEQ